MPARLLTGQVLDESGRPLPAVTVTVPGSARGATTDQDGRFELPLDPASRQIVISYTGFTTEEVTLRPDDENVQVVLGSQVELSEVVATGRTAPRVRMQAEQMASATGEVAQVRPPNGYRSLRRLLQEQKPADLPGGIVRLSFQLNADGKPVDIDVLEASAPGLGNYVREQLSRQGGWRIVRGQPPVPVTYTIRLR